MSITAIFQNGLSGLNMAARGTEIVSANIANALTEGYGTRSVELGAVSVDGRGAGVRVLGITRASDPFLLAERRQAEAEMAEAETRSAFFTKTESAIGEPGQPHALAGRLAAFEGALVRASGDPGSTPRLAEVLETARSVIAGFADISQSLQPRRAEADRAIAAGVEALEAGLGHIARLNTDITAARAAGRDATALLDQRQASIDGIADLVPLRLLDRPNGQVALYSQTGAVLLDGSPARIAFQATPVITADMTLASGALSGLSINGTQIDTAAPRGPLAGGRLAALFAERDTHAPAVQAGLDQLARDLVERFQSPGPDATLPAGAAGLFTDAGAAFVPGTSLDDGLSARLTLNPAADPAEGGALWRLRSGLGAATPGAPGDSALLLGLVDALGAVRPLSGGPLDGRSGSAGGLAAELLSLVATQGQAAARDATVATTRRDTLADAEALQGVDTDDQLQKLLVLERAYAANARVIQAADALLKTIVEI